MTLDKRPAHPTQPGSPGSSYDFSDPGAKISVGEAISSIFSTYFSRFWQLYGFAVLGSLPMLLFMIFGEFGIENVDSVTVSRLAPMFVVIVILSGLLNLCLQGAVAVCVYRVLRDEESYFFECIKTGLARIVTLILISFLFLVISMGFCVGAGFITITVIHTRVAWLMLIAAGLLIIVGIRLFLSIMFSIPVCMVERLGALESIRRSVNLIKSNYFACFVVILVIAILNIVVILISSVVSNFTDSIVFVIISSLLVTIPSGLATVAIPVLYYQLRAAKENFLVEDEADIFD
ncbi:MAG: hypothetical protein LBT47_02930 [Deltaproteobacteria bacterium]|jgi:hypothetical protein|nr:hypothetical protein [Deltaproteobacteria bacterium]